MDNEPIQETKFYLLSERIQYLVVSYFDGVAKKLAVDVSTPKTIIYDMLNAKKEDVSPLKYKNYQSRLINLVYNTKEIYYCIKVRLSTHIGVLYAGFMRI